jgi:hypothetical protein
MDPAESCKKFRNISNGFIRVVNGDSSIKSRESRCVKSSEHRDCVRFACSTDFHEIRRLDSKMARSTCYILVHQGLFTARKKCSSASIGRSNFLSIRYFETWTVSSSGARFRNSPRELGNSAAPEAARLVPTCARLICRPLRTLHGSWGSRHPRRDVASCQPDRAI